MEIKPIFVIYLPVGSLSKEESANFIQQCMDNIKSEIHGWTLLIAPTRISDEIRFEAFHVNNLKPVEQDQILKIKKLIDSFIAN